jgi:hypothetical protein
MKEDTKAPADRRPVIHDKQWKPGQSGNPAGRPVNARNRLSERFLTDMLADWEAHGAEAILKFRGERPGDYVKVMAAIVPKEFSVKVNEMEELTDEQLGAQLAVVLAELAAAGVLAGTRGEAAAGPQPHGALLALPQAG